MQQPAESAPAQSFAGLLASLATPPKKTTSPWDCELADDVAILSYESALRAHARYRQIDDPSLPEPPSGRFPPVNCEPQRSARPNDAEHAGTSVRAAQPAPMNTAPKTASITIRMSDAEREQLLRRAAESGLTVSAYLRSCTFEVESLRAMVKDTLTQLKQDDTRRQGVAARPRRSLSERLKRLLRPGHAKHPSLA